MEETKEKTKHWKGQSRVLKVCHWCAKKQDPEQKAFQACGRCKEVIYCAHVTVYLMKSRECQVASWPLHKAPCKSSIDAKKLADSNPAQASAVANFKKWHSLHLDALRHAAICALDLGNNPKALDNEVLFIEVKLKVGHKDLLIKRCYEPIGGFKMTLDEVREMFGPLGAGPILDSLKEANVHMRKKGGLGVVAVLMQAHGMIDLVKILLPSPAGVKQAQNGDNWGNMWLGHLRTVVETD